MVVGPEDVAISETDLILLVTVPFIVTMIGAIGTIFARRFIHPRWKYYNPTRRLQRHRWEAFESAYQDSRSPVADGGEDDESPVTDGGAVVEGHAAGSGTLDRKSIERRPIVSRSGTVSINRDGKRDQGFGLWNPPSRETARKVIAGVLDSGTDSLPEWMEFDESDSVEDGLELLEEPKLVYRHCRWSFRQSYWLFIAGWVPATIGGVLVLMPRSRPVLIGAGVFLSIGIVAFFGALYKAYRFWWLRRDLDRLIEDAEMF